MRIDLGTAPGSLPQGFDKFVDLVASPDVPPERMIVADLDMNWPFANDSVDHFRAADIIEHLVDRIHTMNELHRCLKPRGTVEIVVPTTDGPGAFMDPTHVSFWHERSFFYYEAGNPYRERFARSYGITAAFRTITKSLEQTQDGPKLTIVLAAFK
jgi:SAM-dependent methyltransferase